LALLPAIAFAKKGEFMTADSSPILPRPSVPPISETMPDAPVETELPTCAAPARSAWDSWRRLLARNPFYILSAALLLWSMRLLSLDSRIFVKELPQLLFNFSSFQFYELLLGFTAIALARRRVWYDAGLLVGLENLFICVPFLLVSQALLLENGVAFGLCLAICALALLRVGALKRALAELNMPAALLWAGALLLAFNLGWPGLIRYLHKDLSSPAWDGRGLVLTGMVWNWIMPSLVALGALLPVRAFVTALTPDEEAPFFSWRSFPVLTLLCWVGGTCVHLYFISYVYGLPWSAGWLTPAIWMAAWIWWWHAENFAPGTGRVVVERLLLVMPLWVVATAAATGRGTMCLTLALFNVVVCGIVALMRRDRSAAHLAVISALLAGAFAAHFSNGWNEGLRAAGKKIDIDVVPMLLIGGLFYVVACALFSKRAKLGIAGGICLWLGLNWSLPAHSLAMNLALQAGLIFILLHSLRWSGENPTDAAKARKLCGLYWLAHTIVWVAAEPHVAVNASMACGAVALELYALARLITKKWGPLWIAYFALMVISWGPFYLVGRYLLRAPDGVLALLGSFVLFGIGTVVALMKSRGRSESKFPKEMNWKSS
jgi:hypothetical protein